jgi:branched-chain amino acid aminotransferase
MYFFNIKFRHFVDFFNLKGTIDIMNTIFPVELTKNPRPKVASDQLGFGKYFSDHMFLVDYENGQWVKPRIVPYGPISLEPGASVFHYGQAMFEGTKAFRAQSGKIHLFRPEFHADRIAEGAKRLCMPSVPRDLFLSAIDQLVKVDQSWIPNAKDSALYLRPTLIGTESFLGVRPSEKYLFFIITSPVGPYYAEKFSPVKIWIEDKLIRAAAGGLGAIKAAANYAASLQASTEAKKKNFSQVLWLDAAEHKFIEEVGTMNVFFKINDKVITPKLDGSILAGATRDSVIKILNDWGIPVSERKISLAEIDEAKKSGTLQEMWGTGTAAVISPVGLLANEKYHIEINQGKVGLLTEKLYRTLSDIHSGAAEDKYSWIKVI